MLTRNFYNFVMANTANAIITEGYTCHTGVKTDAKPYSSAYPLIKIYNLTTNISDSGYGVNIGSGTTPPTAMDYTLETPIISGFGVVQPSSGAISREDDCTQWSATYAITNIGTENMTISEIGLFGQSTANNVVRVLYDRTVLEAPIVIEPGHCKMVTYTIQFNYPA